jgi:hypothetical protein
VEFDEHENKSIIGHSIGIWNNGWICTCCIYDQVLEVNSMSKMKKIIATLLAVLFLVTVTAGAASAFKVDKSWIQDKKIDKSSITLNRYSDKKWNQLPVTLLSEDNKYLYFTAKTPGL